MQVVGNITKLVLRNNALASTRGIEKLYSLEALDLSHNIISTFREVELLGGVPALHSLWLEGNPVSVSTYYREEVFSFFSDTSKVGPQESIKHACFTFCHEWGDN
jgi:hypothetical protein